MNASSNASSNVVAGCIAGDKASVARLISWAENQDPRFAAAMRELYPRVGHAWRIGVTGPPGAGKSTLVNEIAKLERARGRTVGILAVDPSSPKTGGALLGDRIRMEDRTLDAGVYIRSMASRESHGGLARATVDACDVIDAAGFDDVVVETVGVGQSEYEVVAAADTIVLVLCPGAGDGIQAMKAGILEVADVLVVNKSDLAGADRLAMDLDEAVHMHAFSRVPEGSPAQPWIPRVVTCSAARAQGVDEVVDAIDAHRASIPSGTLAAERKKKRVAHVRRLIEAELAKRLWGRDGWTERAQVLLDSGRTPYDVVESLVGSMLSIGATSEPRGTKRP